MSRRIFILHMFLSIATPIFTQNDINEGSIRESGENETIDVTEEEPVEEILAQFEDNPRISMKNRPKNFKPLKLTPGQIQNLKIWEDGNIPYYIDVVSYSDKVTRDFIRYSLYKINSIAGVNFVELPSPPKKDNERWVFFVNRRGMLGCADHTVKNFTLRGVQQVILGYDCIVSRGELAEAVMTILGVPAQHNSPDRDDFITVNTESIMPDKRHLFEKISTDNWLFGDLGYDFESITHYGMHKYSVDGHATVVPKDDSKDINPSKSFSQNDILKIKMLYADIMKKTHLHEVECEKLFKPRNKFERFSAVAHKQKKKKRT